MHLASLCIIQLIVPYIYEGNCRILETSASSNLSLSVQ